MYNTILTSLGSIFSGIPLLDWSVTTLAIIVIANCFAETIATTVYLHRSKTHNAVKLNKVVEIIFEFILWLNTGVKTALWILVHKEHHKNSDQKNDLHSPKNPLKIFGLKIYGPIVPLIKYFYLYGPLPKNIKSKVESRIVNETAFEKFVFHKLSLLGPILLLGTYYILFGTTGLWMFTIQFFYLPVVAGFGINGLGHSHKKINPDTRDYSSTLLDFLYTVPKKKFSKFIYWTSTPARIGIAGVLDFITGGEWRHLPHHLKLASARITIKKWHWDTGWIVIYILYLCKLAKNIKYYSPKLGDYAKLA